MIKVKNINGAPKKLPDPLPKFGNHSDSDFFYFFESEQEREDFYNELPAQVPQPVKDKIDEFSDDEIEKLKIRLNKA